TDAETGGLGSGKEHGDVREDIERADAKALAATVNRDLVKPIIDLNFGPQKKYPRLRIGRADQVDIDKFTTAVERMVRVGLRVGQAEVRDKLGIEDPGEDEELLSASAERPPEMAQDAPGGKGGAPTPAGKAAPGFLRPLKASYGAIAASATPPESGGDLIDQSAERDLDGWRPVMAPKLTALETLAAACSTFEEFQERLPEALAGMDSGQLTELLAQGAFAGKIAGLVGVDLAGADLAGEG
ncbi:MAG: phage portal protein family protein, partial [Caulobacteraceae bacterium]